MPTGSGKTRCGSVIALKTIAKSGVVDILVHRRETAKQFHNTLLSLGHNAELCIAENKNVNWDADILIGMVETYHRRKESHSRIPRLILCDEAHRGEFRKIVTEFDGYVLGLTATPIAAAKDSPLNSYFDGCINPISQEWLIKNKYLCEVDYYLQEFNQRALTVKAGEFTEKSQLDEFSKPKLFKGALRQYQKFCDGQKAICYNVNIEHSIKMHDEFTMAGIKSWHLDGKTPDGERDRILQEFNDYVGGCVLNNVGVATTGTDIPSVEVIILNRATTQLSLYHQMVGRGGRIIKDVKYKFSVIDMGGNTQRFRNVGVYGADVDWQFLFNNPTGAFDGREVKVMKKSCPKCAKTISYKSRACDCCGHIFPHKEMLKFAELSKDLVLYRQIMREAMPKDLQIEVKNMTYSQLVRYGEYMGYAKNWAGIQIGIRNKYK